MEPSSVQIMVPHQITFLKKPTALSRNVSNRTSLTAKNTMAFSEKIPTAADQCRNIDLHIGKKSKQLYTKG